MWVQSRSKTTSSRIPAYTGVDFENAYSGINAGDATAGNTISDNLIQNLGGGGYGYGVGVIVYNNFYANVTANVLDTVRVGVQTGNYSDANPGAPATISDNSISAYRTGIFYNLNYDAASPFTISGNTISASSTDDPSSLSRYWTGVLISSQQGSVSATFSDNQIDGTDATYTTSGVVAGYTVWNTPTTGLLELSGGSVSGVDYGVWVNNYAGYGPSDAGASTQVTVDGVSITASEIGVYIQDDPLSGTDPSVFATIEGDTTISATDGDTVTGIEASGSAASVAFSGTLPAYLTGGPVADGGLTEYIVLTSGAMGGVTPSTLDASQVSFNGFVGADGILPDDLSSYYGIEDKITDYLDDDTLGYVSLNSGDVFVAQSSESPNAGSIQRGINAASSGDTVYVQAGTFVGDVTIDKNVNLSGAGSGSAPATNTVVEPSSSGDDVITFTASGSSSVSPLTVSGLYVSGGAAGLYFNSTLANITLDNVAAVSGTNEDLEVHNSAVLTNLVLTDVSLENSVDGFRVATTGQVSGLTVSGSHFDNDQYGFYTNADSSSTTNQTAFTNIQVSGSTFSNDTYKGIYTEKLDNATFTNITVDDSGTGTSSPDGINFNLKFGTFSNIEIDGATLSDDGTGLTNGAGISIAGRNDSYGAGTILSGLTLTNVTVDGSPIDVSLGNNITGITMSGDEFGGSGVGLVYYVTAATPLDLADTIFDGSLEGYIIDSSPNAIDATEGATFDGFDAGTGTVPADLATYFAIEDKIGDYLDNPAYGYVSLKSDPVFVAQSSESTNAGAIQRGVNVAGSGDTVYVQGGPIDYAGDVTITQPLTLSGANAGVNPITETRNTESVVNGTDFGFWVQADDVTINGFTVQGVTGAENAGIYLPSTISGYQIVYNIVQNNNMGLYANSSGALASLIQYNLIQDNTLGGPAADNGIYLDAGLLSRLDDRQQQVHRQRHHVRRDRNRQ